MPIDLEVQQGATYSFEFGYVDDNGAPIDLSTGWGAIMQIREWVADSGDPVIIELTHEDGLVLGDGTITIELTDAQTEALDFSEDEAVYDLKIYTLEAE